MSTSRLRISLLKKENVYLLSVVRQLLQNEIFQLSHDWLADSSSPNFLLDTVVVATNLFFPWNYFSVTFFAGTFEILQNMLDDSIKCTRNNKGEVVCGHGIETIRYGVVLNVLMTFQLPFVSSFNPFVRNSRRTCKSPVLTCTFTDQRSIRICGRCTCT